MYRRFSTFIILMNILFFSILSDYSFAKEQLAVMTLDAKYGVEKGLAKVLSVIIRDEIHSFGEFTVLGMADLKSRIKRKARSQNLRCDDTQCLIKLGQKIGIRYIVAGYMSKRLSTYSISLRLIDTKGKRAGLKKKIKQQCRCSEDDLFVEAKTSAAKLMGMKIATENKTQNTTKIVGTTGLGQKFTNQIGQTFVFIKPGKFEMGSPLTEKKRDKDETQHEVTITTGFYMQTTEVTQSQWKKIMGDNPSFFNKCGGNCPVENVSWNDVQAFIAKLNSQATEKIYRLPTEAQWEYACRAGTTTPFNTGNCLSTSQANYEGNFPYSGCPKGKYRRSTIPVARFAPNAWGLYDMHGNVYEWCHDWYGDYPNFPISDPAGPRSGTARILRGACWIYYARNCRSADRGRSAPGSYNEGSGFRLICLQADK